MSESITIELIEEKGVKAKQGDAVLLSLPLRRHATDILGVGIPKIGDPEQADAALDAVAMWLRENERGITLLSWEKRERDLINAALERKGYVAHRRKLFVDRDLVDNPPASTHEPWNERSLEEIGRERFIEIMQHCSEGDPFIEEESDPERELDERIEYAENAFDPKNWFTIEDERGTIGVLLPQIYPDIHTEGTLYYIGVAPERRGEGWGKRLHAHGLALLASRGATRYVGSTDLRNEPMVRVFRHNRCNDRGVQVMYRNEE